MSPRSKRDLFPLCGDKLVGVPEEAELGDYRGTGDRRPRAQPGPFRGRPAAVVRHQPAVTADLQHQSQRRRIDRLAGARPQHLDQKRVRGCAPLSLATGAQPRCDDHAAPLHRRFSRDRGQVSRVEQHRRVPGRRFPDLRHDRERQSAGHVDPKGPARLRRGQWQVPARPGVEHHDVDPGGERQDGYPAVRHHHRRPPAQRRQCRADRPQFVHLDRRLGVPGPSRR